MKKLILPSLLLLAGIGASVPVWSAQPPCLYHPEVAGCIGSMPSDYGSSGSKSPIVHTETTTTTESIGFVVSQPNGSQSWQNVYAKSSSEAMSECRTKNTKCTRILEFGATCGSIVSGGFRQANDGQSLFTATGKSQEQAISKATQQCQANSLGNCKVISAICPKFHSYTLGYKW